MLSLTTVYTPVNLCSAPLVFKYIIYIYIYSMNYSMLLLQDPAPRVCSKGMFQRPAPNVCSIHFQYAPMHGFRSLNNKIYIITQYYNYFSTSSPNYFPVPQTISRRQPTRRQPKSRIREPSFFLFQSEYI